MEVAQEINRIYCNGQIIVELIRVKHKNTKNEPIYQWDLFQKTQESGLLNLSSLQYKTYSARLYWWELVEPI